MYVYICVCVIVRIWIWCVVSLINLIISLNYLWVLGNYNLCLPTVAWNKLNYSICTEATATEHLLSTIILCSNTYTYTHVCACIGISILYNDNHRRAVCTSRALVEIEESVTRKTYQRIVYNYSVCQFSSSLNHH